MEYRKEGESGRRKLTEITRYGTLGLALFQSFVTANGLQAQGMVMSPGWQFLFVATITMTTGAMFLMWLGEQITERGVGNGISMIILGGIVAGFPGAIGRSIEQINTGEMSGLVAIVMILVGQRAAVLRCDVRLRPARPRGRLRRADRVLLLLLHGAGVQRARDGRQPQEVGRLHPRHPPRPADRRVHRQGAHAAHALGRAVQIGR